MKKLSQEAIDFIENNVCFMASASANGYPHVVPKGNVAVFDQQTIVFADLYSGVTRHNITENPFIALSAVNIASYRGIQIKGKAEIIERGQEYDHIARALDGRGQLNHPDARYAVKISIEEIINIGYGQGNWQTERGDE